MVSIVSFAFALWVGAVWLVVLAVALSGCLLWRCNLAVQAAISKVLTIIIVSQERRNRDTRENIIQLFYDVKERFVFGGIRTTKDKRILKKSMLFFKILLSWCIFVCFGSRYCSKWQDIRCFRNT